MSGGLIHFMNTLGAQAPPPGTDARADVEGYIIGCDLGQANDFTALSILEKHLEITTTVEQKGFEPPNSVTHRRNVFHLRHLQRLKLGTGYPDIVGIVGTMLKALPPAKQAAALVVDPPALAGQ